MPQVVKSEHLDPALGQPGKSVAAPEREPGSKMYYAEPSLVARRVLWHVFSVTSRSIRAPDYHEPFEKPGAHLFWVASGEGELRLESGTIPLRPGRRIWLVNMNQPRTYAPLPGKKVTLTGFRFGGPALDAWLELINEKHPSEIALGHFALFRTAQRELVRLVTRRPSGWEWQIHETVNSILGRILIARHLLDSTHQEIPPAVVRVLNAVASDPLRDWKATDLASVAQVSYSRLRALFQRSQKSTLHQYIQRMRVDHARLLLADRRLSIKDVSNQLHFSSEFYFSHFFKNMTGMSPRQYRQGLG